MRVCHSFRSQCFCGSSHQKCILMKVCWSLILKRDFFKVFRCHNGTGSKIEWNWGGDDAVDSDTTSVFYKLYKDTPFGLTPPFKFKNETLPCKQLLKSANPNALEDK